ncbi:MAG: hypothetical protein HY960_12765 [Ignavibacteriae bacterium]|nr:hypothetical protein [Ignavibacteriota bacterium]
MNIYITLAFTGIALIGFIVVYGAIKYRTFRKDVKFLYWYFVYDFATSIGSVLLAYQQTNNHWIAQLQIPVFYSWFVLVLAGWIRNAGYSKSMKYSILPLLVMWGIVSLVNPDVWITYDIISFPIAFIFIIVFALLVIFETMKDSTTLLLVQPEFWISTGLILYSICTLTSLLFARQLLLVSVDTLMLVWMIRNVISIIAYLSFTIGLFRGRDSNYGSPPKKTDGT